MNSFGFAVRSALLMTTGIAALPQAALSQEAGTAQETAQETAAKSAGTEVEEGNTIKVVGQRQAYLGTTPLNELPQIVQTLDAATLRDAGVTTLQSALDFTGGVTRTANFGGLFDSYAIRGFVGDGAVSSSYLLNGFNASRSYGGARDASNIERIELIKGPTSALFGRGDPGGAVNIVTKQPYFSNGASFDLTGGSYKKRRVQGDVNVAVTGNLAVRVTGAYDEGDSYRDYVHHKTYSITPSVLWQIDSATSLSYNFEYMRTATPFDRGIVAVDGDLYAVPRSRFFGEPGDGNIKTHAIGHMAQFQHDFDGNWTILLGAARRTSELSGFSTEAENSISRQKLYTDDETLSRQRRYREYSSADTIVRAELSGKFDTFGLVHSVQIGADWDYLTLDSMQARFRPSSVATQTTLAAGHAVNIYNPVYGDSPAVTKFLSTKEDSESAGVYVQDMIDITDWIKLRAGGRYDTYDQHFLNRMTSTVTRQYKTAFSPQVGLSVLPTNWLTLYASFGRGFRPNTGTNASGEAFAPERTRAYEVGAKFAAFHQRLTGSLALFTMKKTNVLTADPVNANYSLAIGEARSRGIEFSLNGKLPYGVRVDLNYSYTDAINDKDALDPDFGYNIYKGDPLLGIPKNSGSALVFKDFEFMKAKASIGAGVNYVGKRLGETGYSDANGDYFMLPSYTLTRVMASISPTDHLRISGEVSNLFDVQYFPSSYSRVWLMPGAPRQFTVTLGYTF